MQIGCESPLRELWAFRGTVLAFAERDIRLKYKQAALGGAWAVIQPLAFLGVFAWTLGHLAKVPGWWGTVRGLRAPVLDLRLAGGVPALGHA